MIQRTIPRVGNLKKHVGRLLHDDRGVAFIEFAYALPVFMVMALGGVELTQFVTTKMRVSQAALHVADHAARIGSGTVLAAKKISETQINDLFTGSGMQASGLDLYGRGRVILTNLEPVASPNTTDRYKITWQRCKGSYAQTSTYGTTGTSDMTGIGPAGRQVKAPNDGATMFVEISYRYRPIIASKYVPAVIIKETASMMVRDRRDMTRVYNDEGATASSC